MRIKLTILLFFIISSIVLASNKPKEEARKILSFKPEFKVEKTFSSSIGKNCSLHLLIGKTELKAFFADETLAILELNTITIHKNSKIVGQHINDDIITLIISYSEGRNDFIQIYDLDFYNNKISISDPINNEYQIIATSKDHFSYIIYSDQKSLSFRKITSINKISDSTVNFEENPNLKELFNKNYHYKFMNQKQYVPTGPFSFAHTYFDKNNHFIFVLDYKRYFKFAKIDPDKINDAKMFELDEYPKAVNDYGIKFNAKYFYNDHVYFFYGSSQSAEIKIINTNTYKVDKIITLLPDSKFVLKNGENERTTFKKYLRSVQGGTKEVSIAINELAKNEDLVVRFDYVDNNNSIYHSSTFDTFNTQPYIPLTKMKVNESKDIDYEKESDFTYHYIILNSKFDFINHDEIKYKKLKMDKLGYIDFAKEKKLKHTSHVFLNNKYRSFSYDKKLNKVVLRSFI